MEGKGREGYVSDYKKNNIKSCVYNARKKENRKFYIK